MIEEIEHVDHKSGMFLDQFRLQLHDNPEELLKIYEIPLLNGIMISTAVITREKWSKRCSFTLPPAPLNPFL